MTLALPHRAALVASSVADLRPEQALNRCVRGLLTALRRVGVDPIYPGLDAVTAGGRTLAAVSLAESSDGVTLFQAVLAWSESFAQTPALLDRADPEGLVPMALAAASSFTCVAALSRGALSLDLGSFAARIGEGYRESSHVDVVPCAPPPATITADEAPAAGVEPPPDAGTATRQGRIGPVTVWVRRDGDVLCDAGVFGDLMAPISLPAELGRRVAGVAPDRGSLRSALTGWLDGRERYLLGITEAELIDLLAEAAA